jgi:uncharacterized membrane protein (DUF485 family)
MEEKGHGVWDKEHETGKGHWQQAYESDIYKEVVKRRFRFVIPVIVFFSVVFFILFTIQHYFKSFASTPVFSNINVNFLYSMLLFPVLWIIGLLFLRYVRKYVYPLETEIINTFSKK